MANQAEDMRAVLETQIADLKREVSRISRAVAARAGDVAGSAEDVYEDARGRASLAVRQVRDQAQLVSGAARENPGTAAAVVSTVGILGFVAGAAFAGLFGNRR